MQTFELLLGLAQEAGIGDGVAVGVRVELFQSNIDPYLRACGDVFHCALGLYRKLGVVAISPLDDAHPLDLFDWELRDLLFFVADEPNTPDATAIGEGEMLPVRIDFPSGVLYSTDLLSC